MPGVPPPNPALSPTDPGVRVRRMRAARGACWVIVAALTSAAAFALLDAAVRLPGWVRGLGLAVWVTGVGVLAWRFVFRPWQAEPPRNPVRQARVELHGNLRAATAAAVSIAACLLVGTFVPGAAEHLRRVALPWQKSSAAYRVVVTSGEPVVAHGGNVTLTGYVEKTDAAPPPAATLVTRDGPGVPERRLPMAGDGTGAFHATLAAPADFEYRIECAGATSEWFAVTSVDPVELAEGSVTEIVPPKYAQVATKTTQAGFAPIQAVQFAAAELRLRFTRPAADAYLEFRPEGAPGELVRVALGADSLSGTASFRLRQDGTLRLVTVAERNGKRLRTETGPVGVRVKPDAPPRIERVAGLSPRPMAARPGDRLSIELSAADDVAVGSAVLEWAAGESHPAPVPIDLHGPDRAKTGRLDFELAGKARAGETLRFRLRVSDGRRLDDPPLKPQDATYPVGGWATVRIDPAAPALGVQEITGRRDAIRESLDAALRELREAAEGVGAVAADAEVRGALPTEQVARLNNARDGTRKAGGLLTDAAREAVLNPELRPLGAAIRSVADGYLKDADEALKRATSATPADRPTALAAGAKHLADATDRIDELVARNDRTARDRLDSRALAALAADQSELAGKPDPRRQAELLARLRALLSESDPLRDATGAAEQLEFDRLAAIASELAGLLGELNGAARDLHGDARNSFSAAATREQKALAAAATALLTRIETAARLAHTPLPKADEFRRAATLLADGVTVEALTEMVRLAVKLEEVATEFEKWANARADAKKAAEHLALWQEDLRDRFRKTAGANPANFKAEQSALRAAAAALRIPSGNGVEIRKRALEHLTGATNFLDKGANPDPAMKAAGEELKRLADALPAIPERLAKTRAEFDKLHREQELIQTAVEQVLRNADPATLPKRLAAVADRQANQLAPFAALDLPGLDPRRERCAAALGAAASDLRNGLGQDVPASQAWARREFERLRGALFDNAQPPDEKADELVRRTEGVVKAVRTLVGARPEFPACDWTFLAVAADAAGPQPRRDALDAQSTVVQEVARVIGQWPRSPEVAALLSDAQEAVRTADFAFRNNTGPGELLRKLRTAADELAEFADRLNGAESDHDRLRRLAASRRRAAARAKGVAPGSPVNGESGRQLGRELEELIYTRVGAAGQGAKKRLLDQFARLRDHPAPDRQAGAHANLAEALDELAGLTADVEELALGFGRAAPPEPTDADAYLPSRHLADDLRSLARQYRTARDRVTDLPGELVKWTRPADGNPLAAIERRQRELAADAAALAEALSVHAEKFPVDPYLAASEALKAADRFRIGSVRAGREAGGRSAGLLRKLAGAEHARDAPKLAERQDAILADLARLPDSPGVAIAQQQALADELARRATELAETLEGAARDAGADDPAAKALSEASRLAKSAGKVLTDAGRKAAGGKADDAATLRDEAAALFRVVAAKAAGAGPAPTTLPALDPETAAVGESLRQVGLAMRRALRGTDEKVVGDAARTAADELDRAAKGVRERVSTDGK